MTGPARAGRAAVALALVALAALAPAAPAVSQDASPPPPPARRAFLFLIDRVSFEELLAVPDFAALTRSGGAGLLSVTEHQDDGGLGAFLTIGAGAKAAVPSSRIAARPAEDALPPATLDEIRRLNDSAVPGLLTALLEGSGRRVAVFGNADDRFGPNAPGLLVGMDLQGGADGQVHGLAIPVPGRLGSVRLDGRALLRRLDAVAPDLAIVDAGDTHRIDQEAPYAADGRAAEDRAGALARDGVLVRGLVSREPGEVLVIVAAPSPSIDMRADGDAVMPVVYARGTAQSLFAAEGPMRGLSSDSTRHPGLVRAEDIAPTILAFFGVGQPSEMTGSPIRVSGEAPFGLHARHLAIRRLRVPVSLGFGLGGLLLSLVAGGLIFARRVPRRALAVAGATASCSIAVPLAMLAAGLVELRFAWVVPTALGVSLAAGLAAWGVRRDDPTFPVVVVAAASGAAVVIDGLLGWHATGQSLAGGTIFEGRAYGMRNVWLGPVLGGTVLVASRLPARWALGVGLGAALFSGFPTIGADVGGFITLSAAAWLLYFSLSRGRVGWKEAALGAAATAAGLAALLVVDGFLIESPTHAGRFAERVASDGAGTLVRVLGERLRLTIELTGAVPIAWLLVAWFALAAVIAPRVGGAVGAAFDRAPGYRDAMWVLALATLVAIFVNDSGIGTAQTAAAFSIGGFVVPALAYRLSRNGRPGTAPSVASRARQAVPV